MPWLPLFRSAVAEPPPPPPPPPPPEPPPPEPPLPVDEPPHNLIIRDKTGRLPKNPKNWPAGLKAAVAGCCGCGQSSSSGSSSSGGGPNIGDGCCGCQQLCTDPPLIATIVSSLFNTTFVVPLSGVGLQYQGTYTTGDNRFLIGWNCTGRPNGFGFFISPTRYCNVKLSCLRCDSAPFGKIWVSYVLITGILNNEIVAARTVYIANLVSCDPIAFETKISTAECGTTFGNCCVGTALPAPFNQCGDKWPFIDALGSTMEIDISE